MGNKEFFEFERGLWAMELCRRRVLVKEWMRSKVMSLAAALVGGMAPPKHSTLSVATKDSAMALS